MTTTPSSAPDTPPGGSPEPRYDAVVVGGGAAGLSGAVALARARRSVLVIDAGEPRNARAAGVHNFLTREGTPPGELLDLGRTELTAYGGEVRSGTVTAATPLPGGGFRVVADDGTAVHAARLLLATGLTDELPDVPGVAERFGREVLHCPYCHGWEVRDQPIGVLATGPLAVHAALLWRQWSKDVTLFLHTGPEPSEEEYEQLAAREIAVVDGPVTGLEITDDRLTGVSLTGCRTVGVRALVVTPYFATRGPLYAGLGLEVVEQEMNGHAMGSHVPTVDPSGRTEVPGVWVAGNSTNVAEQVIGAAAAGLRAGAAINADLVTEETRRAVAERAGRAADPGRHHAAEPDPEALTAAEYWDARYGAAERMWSGAANPALVREAADLPPGRALDLGCGEGADAIWLADRGWRVTAVDVSRTALDRAAAHARRTGEPGTADRIDWQRHDLAASFPDGVYDLVAASYLHSPAHLPRERVLRRAAAAVAPGGVLLVIGHAAPPPWHDRPVSPTEMPTPDQVLASLELPEDQWEVLVSDEHERLRTSPDGESVVTHDNTLKLRRRTG